MFNCLAYPSSGEGFGMCILEGMSCGVPSIATRATGHMDFCTDENSYLIDVEKIDRNPKCEWITAYYRYPFPNEQSRGATFTIPSQPHLQKLMRHVYKNRDELKKKGEKARMDVVRKWDIRLICEQIKQRLLEIQEQRNIHSAQPIERPAQISKENQLTIIRKDHPGETMTQISGDGGMRTIVG